MRTTAGFVGRPLVCCFFVIFALLGRRGEAQIITFGQSGVIGAGTMMGQVPMGRPSPNQQPTSNVKQTVSGVVVNSATNEPIAGALVELNGTTQASQFVGPGGRFTFENVPEGQVLINAKKPGFLDPRSMRMGRAGLPNGLITVSAHMKDVQIQLVPECQIVGRILNEDGEPLQNIVVQIMSEQIINGRKRWMQNGGASTGANGEYRVENQPPGRYIVHTASRAMFVNIPAALQQASERGEGVASNVDLDLGYPSTYYPGASDMSSLQPLEVKPGEQARADFSIPARHGVHVSGTVTGMTGGMVRVQVEGADGQPSPLAARVDPRTGIFRLPLVFPGTWTLVFHSQGAGETASVARLPVTVANTDVVNLQVQLQPLASIPVQVDAPTSTTPNTADASNGGDIQSRIPPVMVQLVPAEAVSNMFIFSTRPQPGEAGLIISGVPPGSYRASVQPMGGMSCLDSISAGGVDLNTSEYSLGEGATPTPIRVALRSDCASLKGTVRSPTPNPTGTILLVAKSLAVGSKQMPISQDGSFSFKGLSPGDYQLYALSDVSGLEYEKPEALRELAGQEVHLDPSQQATASPDLIVRGGSQ